MVVWRNSHLAHTSVIGSCPRTEQQVWGVRYVDDLILRDRDADSNSNTGNLGLTGSGLEERRYSVPDAHWSVAAIAGPEGQITERYAMTAYGSATFLLPDFGARD